MKQNGLIAEITCKENTSYMYIVPAMLPYADENELSTALNKPNIQTSKTICLKTRNMSITRPVFHVVLAKCIQKYTLADPSFLDGLDSQSISERKTCSKNFGYFTMSRPRIRPWHFVLAYQLGYIRVTLFRKRKDIGEQDCSEEGRGVELLNFVKESLVLAIDRYHKNDDFIRMFIDTNVFRENIDPVEINDDLYKEMKKVDDAEFGFTIKDMITWFPKNKVR